MNLFRLTFSILIVILSSSALSADFTVAQKNKAFSQTNLKVKVGDTVNFKNEDSFFHNVFSLSDAQFFDLGSYPKGESKSVKFETPGQIEVECAIHPEMMMTIDVE
jgi:plastocyanin